MRDLVESIAKAIVDHPEEVQVTEIVGSQVDVLELSVAKVDLGKVIGRYGRTAEAIRTILNASRSGAKKKVMLEIIE